MKSWLIIGLAIAAVAGVGLWGRAQYQAGQSAERAAAVERTAELIRKRANDDDAISRMDDAAICAELGGNWLLDRCE